MLKNRYVFVCLLSCVSLVLFSMPRISVAQEPTGGAPQKEAPPQFPVIQAGDDFQGKVFDYAQELQMFFDAQGANYAVAFGIGDVQAVGENSRNRITAISLGYKMAMLQAYADLSQSLNPDGVNVTTKDGFDARLDSGDVVKDILIEECWGEARTEHDKYLKRKERERLAQLEEERSATNKVLNLFKSDERIESELEQQRLKTEQQPPEPDFVHVCRAPGEYFVQPSSVKTSISDSLSGGRIWATAMHENQIAVVLVRSDETAVVASVLKNQMAPANPLPSAFAEVRSRVLSEIENYPGIPMGIVGTRMMRLSNGEWAIYAFGAAQEEKKASPGGFGGLRKTLAANSGSNAALGELSRFSGMMVNADNLTNQLRATQQTFVIEINVTQGTDRLQVETDESIGEVLNVSFSGTSDLQLTGSKTVFNKMLETDGISYRLQAEAWSPSIMAGNLNKRYSQDAAAENALNSGDYVSKESLRAGQQKGTSGAEKQDSGGTLNTDW